VHGGAVKYGYLDRRLPHAGLQFHILYAVSSSHCADLDRLIQVAQDRGAKVVWNQNGVYHPQSYADAPRLNAQMASLYKRADHVFYQSQFCLSSAYRFLGERTGPGEILYNAVDTKFFVPALSKNQEGQELRLLMAGSHYWDYRLACGIRTLASVRRTRPARLLIAGRMIGELEVKARRLITELHLEPFVDFLGPYKRTEAPAVFQQGDIYLHTKYIDPCPSVVIEAMACGLPVVYSKSGGTVELVGEEAGAGVPAELSWSRNIPPDPEQLAACVLRVADDLPRYSQAARERAVTHFDLEPWLERHIQVFEMLMEK
jgi:glycosyltransferase involved in cell wall biosynthesis